MSWRLILAVAAAVGMLAAQPSKTIWNELGLQAISSADPGANYRLNTWLFKDATGAIGGALLLPGSTQLGNYVVTCQGRCPKDLTPDIKKLPGYRGGTLPVLHTYPPNKGIVPKSERYVLGPEGLLEAAPSIPVSAPAFQFGTEGDIAKYRIGKTEATLAVFMFPLPQMARQQLPEFQKIPGAVAKRSGPTIGVVLNAPDEKTAENLLSTLEYSASLSWDDRPPLVIRPQTAAQIVLAAIELSGLIMVFCLLSGLAFGGFRALRRRLGYENAQSPMTVLGLQGK
jgi:hypothetical protein